MADQDTGLPIRSEADGTDERVHTKLVDGADPGGAGKTTEVSEFLAHIRAFAADPGGTKRQFRLSEQGHTSVNGIYNGTTNTDPSNISIIAHTRSASPADTQQTQRLTSIQNGAGTVRALDIALRDEDGEPFTASNPLPITSVDSEGDEINDYKAAASVAKDAFDDHDYTVTALKTLKLTQIECSGSGKIKVEVKIETGVGTGTFTTKWTQFNSTSNPNTQLTIREPIAVAAGIKVRVTLTNRDNQPQDLYSTISGHEI